MNSQYVVALALFLVMPAMVFAQDKTDESLAKAKELVKKKLEELKGDGAKLQTIEDKYVREMFPNHVFVAVHYPLWPVARVPAEPLKSQNLFAVSKEGKVTHLPDSKNLEEFFKSTLAVKPNPSNTVKSWLRLRTEYVQDGYYKFKQPTVGLPLLQSSTPGDRIPGEVEVVPEMGNKGTLTTIVTFALEGKFLGARDDDKVIRGMRPRCQATLLLHPEKLVREIAEQDLVVMGSMAKGYLMEQRAKANEELRREIDRVWRRIEAEGR